MSDMECPCKNCSTRQFYAKKFDIHIWGDDCPYECERYNAYCADGERKEQSDE